MAGVVVIVEVVHGDGGSGGERSVAAVGAVVVE